MDDLRTQYIRPVSNNEHNEGSLPTRGRTHRFTSPSGQPLRAPATDRQEHVAQLRRVCIHAPMTMDGHTMPPAKVHGRQSVARSVTAQTCAIRRETNPASMDNCRSGLQSGVNVPLKSIHTPLRGIIYKRCKIQGEDGKACKRQTVLTVSQAGPKESKSFYTKAHPRWVGRNEVST